ncbi:MAG: PaaI family thioesterase [bacterium]|nr:PaaI family thioesterase [bacterium]
MQISQKPFKIRNRQFLDQASELFQKAKFIKDVGYELIEIDGGSCKSRLHLQDRHMQQNNFVHAGVIATMADHTAGAAGATLIGENEVVLSVEFKVNLLRPGLGEELICEAAVLKNGKTLIVAESNVYGVKKGRGKLIAKATVTLAVVGNQYA